MSRTIDDDEPMPKWMVWLAVGLSVVWSFSYYPRSTDAMVDETLRGAVNGVESLTGGDPVNP